MKSTGLFVLLTLMCIGCGFSSTPGETLDVRPLIEAGEYAQAEEQLTRALIQAPRNPDVLYNLAMVQRLQGQDDVAVRTVQRALDRAPDDDALLLLLCELQLDSGQISAAQTTYNQISQQGRSLARAQMIQGVLSVTMNDLIQAEAAFRTAIGLASEDWTAQAALAFVLIQQGRPDSAKPILDAMPAAEELPADAIRQLAECFLLLGDPQQAVEVLNTLSAEQINDASLWTLKGRALIPQMRFDEAESFFQRALAAPDASPVHRMQYAQMLFAAQREDDALSEAIRAEEELVQSQITIHDPALYNLMATLYARRGQILLAHRYLNQSLDIDRNQPRVIELIQQLREAPQQPAAPSPTIQP